MITQQYQQIHNQVFESEAIAQAVDESIELINQAGTVFFLGNGGSNAISSHMMEDYAKIGKIRTQCFSDAAMITCYANDYGYEQAFKEWLAVYFQPGDVLVAISSSGNSMNLVHAIDYAKNNGGKVITLTGFSPENKINQLGDVSFHVPCDSFGISECMHHTLLHIVLDKHVAQMQPK